MKTITNVLEHRLEVPALLKPGAATKPDAEMSATERAFVREQDIKSGRLDPDGSGPYLAPGESVQFDETQPGGMDVVNHLRKVYGADPSHPGYRVSIS